MDEQKPFPDIECHRRETKLVCIKIKKTVLIRYKPELSIQTVGPAVEFTRQPPAGAVRVPGEFIAAMRTHIVKGANPAVCAPHDKNGRPTNSQLFDEIIARVGDVLYASNIQPHPTKQAFSLLLKIGERDARLDRDGLRA